MLPKVGQAFVPKSLPDQFATLLAMEQAQLERLGEIAQAISTANADRPMPAPIVVSLPFVTSQQLEVVGILWGGTVAGVYQITVGSAVLLEQPLAANACIWIPLQGEARLTIARGLRLALVAAAGGTAYCQLFAIPM